MTPEEIDNLLPGRELDKSVPESEQQIEPGPGIFESERTYATWQRFEQMLKDKLAAQQAQREWHEPQFPKPEED